MTNEQIKAGFSEVYNEFWCRYKDHQPGDTTTEWERMHTRAAVLRKRFPFLEEIINRMLAEVIERARGRGNKDGDFHMPPT